MHGYAIETTSGGQDNPAHDNQRIFRAILLTMAQPGTVTVLGNWPKPPKGLHPAAAAVCLALVDMDTPLWVGPQTPVDVTTYLSFQCGCPLTRKQEECAFGLVLDGNGLPALDRFNPGEIEYPDRSATLIIQVASINLGSGVNLSGPGIRNDTLLHVEGLNPSFWQSMQQNSRRFPLGYDVILTTETEIVSLPRSVRVGI